MKSKIFVATNRLAVPLIAGLMALLTIAAFFPGGMSSDSFAQLGQALSGSYTNDHPPVMAALWRLLLQVWPNPGVLFMVHVLLYWCFWCLLARLAFQGLKGRLLVLGIACLPPLWSQTTVVWKDTELSITILGAYLFGILAQQDFTPGIQEKKKREYLFLSLALLLLIYSLAVRKNALPAVIPLAFYLISTLFKNGSYFRMIILTCLFLMACFLITDFINYGFLKAKKFNSFQFYEIHELVGLLVQTGRADLIPDYWEKNNKKVSMETLDRSYDPDDPVPLIFSEESPVTVTDDPAQLKELNQKWRMAVRLFPLKFIGHRWEMFKALMAIGCRNPCLPLWGGVYPNTLGIRDQGDPGLQGAIKAYFSFFKNTVLFKGWIYLVMLLGIVAYHWVRHKKIEVFKRPAVCAALSGFFYGIAYFAFAPAPEFRFLYSTVTLCFLSFILTFSKKLRLIFEN